MKTNKMNTENQATENSKAVYEKPVIEVIEMEHEGSILQASDFAPGGGGGDW